MGPICHIGLTSSLLAGSRLVGIDVTPEIIAYAYCGGVLLDTDKVFEIYHRGIKKLPPDITAKDRILHSFLAFPFALLLTFLSNSLLPAIAVLLHIMADSFIPGLLQSNRYYPSHARIKWLMFPCYPSAEQRRKIISKNWPIKYPPRLGSFCKLMEPIGLILTIISFFILIK